VVVEDQISESLSQRIQVPAGREERIGAGGRRGGKYTPLQPANSNLLMDYATPSCYTMAASPASRGTDYKAACGMRFMRRLDPEKRSHGVKVTTGLISSRQAFFLSLFPSFVPSFPF